MTLNHQYWPATFLPLDVRGSKDPPSCEVEVLGEPPNRNSAFCGLTCSRRAKWGLGNEKLCTQHMKIALPGAKFRARRENAK